MKISVLSFKFDDFESIPLSRNTMLSPHSVISAPDRGESWTSGRWATDYSGNSWRLRLCLDDYPDGSREAMVSFSIDKEEDEENSTSGVTKFTIILRDAIGSVVKESAIESPHISFDCKDFIERYRVLDKDNNILLAENGALRIDVLIEPEHKVEISLVSPQNMLASKMLEMFESGHMADLVFKFSNGSHCFAHKLILSAVAPGVLQSFYEDDVSTVCLDDATPYIVFRQMLRYIYGGGLPEKDFILEHGLDIIDVANKFDVVGLKLEAEAMLVASRIINVENVVEYMLFASAKDCALLKEYTIAMFTARIKDVKKSETSSEFFQGNDLWAELLERAYPC